MKHFMILAAAGGLGLAACQSAPVATTPEPVPMPAAAAPGDASAIPAGTMLDVRLETELNTTTSRVGDTFTVTVTEPLVAQNGQTVIPEGAVITGMVTGVGRATPSDPAAIRLNFLRISLGGVSHPLTAEIAGTSLPMEQEGADPTARAAATGAVVGAVLGAIVTGSLRDALIGAALGAGAGTIISLGMGDDREAVLPAGTRMTLQTRDRVSLR